MRSPSDWRRLVERGLGKKTQLFSMLTYHGNSKEFWARGLPKMQGTKVEPGTSQFRRPWATSVARRSSAKMMRPDLSHSRLFMPLWPLASACRVVRSSSP